MWRHCQWQGGRQLWSDSSSAFNTRDWSARTTLTSPGGRLYGLWRSFQQGALPEWQANRAAERLTLSQYGLCLGHLSRFREGLTQLI